MIRGIALPTISGDFGRRSDSCVRIATLAVLVVAGVPGARAAERAAYSLFNPAPAGQLRDLSTDRPDQTESPYTVDAGHFQIEFDFVNFTSDRDTSGASDVRLTDLAIAPVNLKLGLHHHVDVQLMIDPYVRSRVVDKVAGTRLTASGFGDITTRLKINLWGNDGGSTAFAVMPFVKWPLSASEVRNGETEGGIIVPFALELPAGWNMGAMTELDFVSDGDGGHDTEWLNSITFSRGLTERLGGYVEFVSVHGNAPGFEWLAQFDVGFTYALSSNAQLDCGCNFGLTDSAPDYQPFIGLSLRR